MIKVTTTQAHAAERRGAGKRCPPTRADRRGPAPPRPALQAPRRPDCRPSARSASRGRPSRMLSMLSVTQAASRGEG